MDKKAFVKILSPLLRYYNKLEVPPFVLTAWYNVLKDFSAEEINDLFVKAVENFSYLPTPKQLVALNRPSLDEAWQTLLEGSQTVDAYRYDKVRLPVISSEVKRKLPLIVQAYLNQEKLSLLAFSTVETINLPFLKKDFVNFSKTFDFNKTKVLPAKSTK